MKKYSVKYTFEGIITVKDALDDMQAIGIIRTSLSVMANATHVSDTRIIDFDIDPHPTNKEIAPVED